MALCRASASLAERRQTTGNNINGNNINGIATMMWISAGSLVLGFILGTLCVTLLWHWQRSRYLWAMIVPAAAPGRPGHDLPHRAEYEGIRMDCIEHALCQTVIQCAGIFLGVLLGRKLSRAIVRMDHSTQAQADAGIFVDGGWEMPPQV